ncbi:ABC transporter ATP-binding protein [Tepidimicrobium xylanilyticum]|uniref:NitT/TauT family transport system ATP-binding protein n=1 Tax=Tepidimicrobium xylanilyticum TaxID=1123352 RepID=A0A1H2VH85_9FIRM|nr:ABC transporter ATP-binding protein [Tepidimicrobium xylanilyticum]GMG96637.1 ABC transporter ATP-binding protein [Tepidimicrobium xylanilyticum]SDW67716.1 NitT/TauT family transport system ATP-binding protein [Tepidimicrobium xylanilyticum]
MAYKVEGITKYYGNLKVLDNISIDFESNKTTCILGPSGCGKTTLLNIIAGIIPMDSGQIIGFKDERISYVFQEDRLIKWKNVKENLEFVLRGNMDRKQMENIIDKYLKLVNLEEYKYYYPKKLSGGMRQKVSILRAFAYPSNVLIMDEPFKSLDIKSKSVVMQFFKQLRDIENKTCILVTHDIEEALELGDKIVMLTQKPTKVKKVVNKNIKDARKLIESYFDIMPLK